tara:strand:+ start:286 stop:489 length:204 start_codon:yes stop_codon:yes gene_type:complete
LLTLIESKKIPKKIEAINDLTVEFFSENGNKKITGQHGAIPFIFNQFGDDMIRIGKQIKVKNINNIF